MLPGPAVAVAVLLAARPARATTVYAEPRAAALPVDAVFDLGTDERGWLYVATPSGILRLEGTRSRRWGGPDGPTGAGLVLGSTDGRVDVLDDHDHLLRLTATSATPLAEDPDAGEARLVSAASIGDAFYALRDGALRVGPPWRPLPLDGRVRKVWSGRTHVAVALADAVVELDSGGAGARRLAVPAAVAWAEGAGGQTWIVDRDGGVWRADLTTELRRVATLPAGRVADAVDRDGTLWVAQQGRIVAIGADGAPRELDGGAGLSGAIALAVDREDALWVGRHDGLWRIPSPDTTIWTDRDGLPESGGLALDRVGDRIWVTSWSGPAWIGADGHAERAGDAGAWGEVCRDGDGHPWSARQPRTGAPFAFGRLDDPERLLDFPAAVDDYQDCAAEPGHGGLWLGTGAGLLYLPLGADTMRPTSRTTAATQVLEDSAGEVWVASRDGICHAPADTILAGGGTWVCEPIPAGTWIADLDEVDGQLWATTAEGDGVLYHGPSGWTPLPGAAALPSHRLSWMSPSPRGGVWIAGHGAPFRARPDPGSPDGWVILERLGSAQGLRIRGASAILELPDGDLWLTSDAVYHVPARARARADERPPPPELVSARLDGVELAAGGALGRGHNLAELRYAVPTGRRPDEVRMRLRTADDAPWLTTTGAGEFNLVDLPAGDHHVVAEAAFAGGPWSDTGEPLDLRVPVPWWRSGPALAGWATLAAAAGAGRVAYRRAVRRRLERERQRIAMDLHDEVGSGLGSLALLAGMASEEEVAEPHRREVAGEAARLAEELGDSIQGLVGSLRSDAGSPDALVRHLRTLGARTFPTGEPTFHLDAPARFGGEVLALPVRRQVQLFASEALHNAARHAAAHNVWLRLQAGAEWRLVVEDDGVGLAGGSARPGGGNGVESMGARAARIGGAFELDERPGGGTRATLRFQPRGRP